MCLSPFGARLALAILLRLASALAQIANASEPSEPDATGKFDLYRLDLDDNDELLSMSALEATHDADLVASSKERAGSISPGHADNKPPAGAQFDSLGEEADQDEWQGPENSLDIVRLFHGRYYQGQYCNINSYLVNEVRTQDVDANLAAVGEWLERERSGGVSLFKNRASVEALEQLYALSWLKDEGVKCSRQAYAIMWKNDRATRGRAHRPPSLLGPTRRIELVVHRASLRHAVDCLPVYPKRYQQARAQMDKNSYRQLLSFLDNVLGSPDCVKSIVRRLEGPRVAKIAYHTIKLHSHSDPDRRYLSKVLDELNGRMIPNAKKVHFLLHKYLVLPCRQFLRLLGPDVFIPAHFDALSLEKEDRYGADSRQLVEFLHGWLHYRLCDSLVNRDEEALARDLVQVIRKREN